MASPPVSRVGEARLAGAIARLLRWEAQLLARPVHDPMSRSAALRGLEWAADFARALEAEPCAAWLDALRERANERPGHVPHAWTALGASACAAIAAELEDQKSLAPLSADARGWRTMAMAVRACEEPAPPSSPVEEEPPVAVAPVAPDPFLDVELADAVVEEPDAPAKAGEAPLPVESAREGVPLRLIAGDAEKLADLVRAVESWTGSAAISVDVKGGCVELSGTRPSDHPDEGRLSMDALEALRQLHLATGALPAPLLVEDPAAGLVRWSVRLPASSGARHLFAESAGRRLALPWHVVVTCGLGENGQPHAVLGRGLERVALPLDWLHGLSAGTPVTGLDAEAIAFASPVLAASGRLLEAEAGGVFNEIAVVPLGSPAAEAPEASRAAEPASGGIPEVVQEPASPADNRGRDAIPGRIALVADDSFTSRVFLRRMLAMRGIAVDEAEDGPHALAFLAGRMYDLVFLDAGMPGGGAVDIAPSMDRSVRDSAVVLVRDDAERAAAQAAGFARVLYKPFAEDEVAAALAALAGESRPGA